MADRRRAMRRREIAADAAPADVPEIGEPFTAEIRLFAWVAELARARSVSVELRAGMSASAVIARALAAGGLEGGFGGAEGVRLAINRCYAAPRDVVWANDELALIPPVSGGAPPHVRISRTPLDLPALHALVMTPRAGAVVTLTGAGCEVDRLHIEAYEEMAHACLERIADGLMTRYRLEAVAIEHRVGDVAAAEPALIVAVSAPRPQAAFAAAHEAIDRIRVEAPIWRLEYVGDFRSWVRGGRVEPRVHVV